MEKKSDARQSAVKAFAEHGTVNAAARALGKAPKTVRQHLQNAKVLEKQNDSPLELKARRSKMTIAELTKQNRDLLDRLEDAEKRQGIHEALARPLHIPHVKKREKTSGLREATAIALSSDWHVEETVFPEQVAGRNEYNLEIADVRVRRHFEGVNWLINHNRQSFLVRDAVLWLGGDLITGYIHEELEETNGLAPLEAIHWLKRRIIAGIDSLLVDGTLVTLTVVCSHGNHGRVHKKKRIKTGAQNSYEWAMYVDLADYYANDPRVTFVVDKSAHQYVDVYDFSTHFHHGDELKFGGGVGGITIPLFKRIPQWDRVKFADYHHIGHFHQLKDLGRAMVNGSLIGYGEFAMSIGAEVEPPQQGFYLIDSKRGKTCVSPIWADETVPLIGVA